MYLSKVEMDLCLSYMAQTKRLATGGGRGHACGLLLEALKGKHAVMSFLITSLFSSLLPFL